MFPVLLSRFWGVYGNKAVAVLATHSPHVVVRVEVPVIGVSTLAWRELIVRLVEGNRHRPYQTHDAGMATVREVAFATFWAGELLIQHTVLRLC